MGCVRFSQRTHWIGCVRFRRQIQRTWDVFDFHIKRRAWVCSIHARSLKQLVLPRLSHQTRRALRLSVTVDAASQGGLLHTACVVRPMCDSMGSINQCTSRDRRVPACACACVFGYAWHTTQGQSTDLVTVSPSYNVKCGACTACPETCKSNGPSEIKVALRTPRAVLEFGIERGPSQLNVTGCV